MKEKITITIDGMLLKRLDKMAAKLETSRSALLERFALDELDDQEPVVEFLLSTEGRVGWMKLCPFPNAAELLVPSMDDRCSRQNRTSMSHQIQAALAGNLYQRDGAGNLVKVDHVS